MRSLALIVFLALIISVTAAPITPSAPEYQRRAEQFRLEGLKEYEIAERLSNPQTISEAEREPLLAHVNTRLHSLFRRPSQEEERDLSGDIAPGSLDAPEMLPRAAIPESFADILYQRINAVLRGEDVERRSFAYEGKELEMRRPQGMRHWNFQ